METKDEAVLYEVRISAGKPKGLSDLRELWRFRDLLVLMVRRDYYAKYAQTLLGPLWFLVQPLLTTLVFTFVFAGVARIPTSGAPPMLFYLCGMVPWGYFATTFSSVSTSLTANAGVFSKVYFPRLIVPISYAVSNLFALGIQFGLLLFILFFYGYLGKHWDLLRWEIFFIPVAGSRIGVFIRIAILCDTNCIPGRYCSGGDAMGNHRESCDFSN
jgi:lipopolysaccharide transport system permease protein